MFDYDTSLVSKWLVANQYEEDPTMVRVLRLARNMLNAGFGQAEIVQEVGWGHLPKQKLILDHFCSERHLSEPKPDSDPDSAKPDRPGIDSFPFHAVVEYYISASQEAQNIKDCAKAEFKGRMPFRPQVGDHVIFITGVDEIMIHQVAWHLPESRYHIQAHGVVSHHQIYIVRNSPNYIPHDAS